MVTTPPLELPTEEPVPAELAANDDDPALEDPGDELPCPVEALPAEDDCGALLPTLEPADDDAGCDAEDPPDVDPADTPAELEDPPPADDEEEVADDDDDDEEDEDEEDEDEGVQDAPATTTTSPTRSSTEQSDGERIIHPLYQRGILKDNAEPSGHAPLHQSGGHRLAVYRRCGATVAVERPLHHHAPMRATLLCAASGMALVGLLGGCVRVVSPAGAAAPFVERVAVEPSRASLGQDVGNTVAAFSGDTLVVTGGNWDPASAVVRVGTRTLDGAEGDAKALRVVVPAGVQGGAVTVLSGGQASDANAAQLLVLGVGHIPQPRFSAPLEPQFQLLRMGAGTSNCRETGMTAGACANINAPVGVLSVAFRARLPAAPTHVAHVAPAARRVRLQRVEDAQAGASFAVRSVQTYLGLVDPVDTDPLSRARSALTLDVTAPPMDTWTQLLFDNREWPLQEGFPDPTIIQRGNQKWLVLLHGVDGAPPSGERVVLLPGPEHWNSPDQVETRAANVAGWNASAPVRALGVVEQAWFPVDWAGSPEQVVWLQCPSSDGPLTAVLYRGNLPDPDINEQTIVAGAVALDRTETQLVGTGGTCDAFTPTSNQQCACVQAVCTALTEDGSPAPAFRIMGLEAGTLVVVPPTGLRAPVCTLDPLTGDFTNISGDNVAAADVLSHPVEGHIYWVPTDANDRVLRQVRKYNRTLGTTAYVVPRSYRQLVADPFLGVLHGLPESGNRVHTLDAFDVRLRDTPGVLGTPRAVWPLARQGAGVEGALVLYDGALIHLDDTGGVRALKAVPDEAAFEPGLVPFVEIAPSGAPVAVWTAANGISRLALDPGSAGFPALQPVHAALPDVAWQNVLGVTPEVVWLGVLLDGQAPAGGFGNTCGPSGMERSFLVRVARANAAATPQFVPGTCGVQLDEPSAHDPVSHVTFMAVNVPDPGEPGRDRPSTLLLDAQGAVVATAADQTPLSLSVVPGRGVVGVFLHQVDGTDGLGAVGLTGTFSDLDATASRDSQLAVSPDQRRLYVTTEGAVLEYDVAPGSFPPQLTLQARHVIPGAAESPWLTSDGSRLVLVLADEQAVGVLQ
jgi:hypothetical protein